MHHTGVLSLPFLWILSPDRRLYISICWFPLRQPNVYFIFRAMMNDGQSQSILVSGESGAGKTETTKLIMQYLTYVGGRAAGDDRTVEQQVLEVSARWS